MSPSLLHTHATPAGNAGSSRSWPAIRSAAGGAVAGGIATVAMSIPMLLARWAGWTPELPPKAIVKSVADTDGGATTVVLASALHVAFGAAGGVLFSGLRRAFRLERAAVPAGGLFGVAVWAVSYAGWIPALRLLPPPQRDDHRRQWLMVASHVVYGMALAAILRMLDERSGRENRDLQVPEHPPDERRHGGPDPVTQATDESFPASDPPSWTMGREDPQTA